MHATARYLDFRIGGPHHPPAELRYGRGRSQLAEVGNIRLRLQAGEGNFYRTRLPLMASCA
jgi:hypothetical protein